MALVSILLAGAPSVSADAPAWSLLGQHEIGLYVDDVSGPKVSGGTWSSGYVAEDGIRQRRGDAVAGLVRLPDGRTAETGASAFVEGSARPGFLRARALASAAYSAGALSGAAEAAARQFFTFHDTITFRASAPGVLEARVELFLTLAGDLVASGSDPGFCAAPGSSAPGAYIAAGASLDSEPLGLEWSNCREPEGRIRRAELTVPVGQPVALGGYLSCWARAYTDAGRSRVYLVANALAGARVHVRPLTPGVTVDSASGATYFLGGDADGDGTLTPADAAAIMRGSAGLLSPADPILCDVAPLRLPGPYDPSFPAGYGDGIVDIRDAQRLLRHIAGLDNAAPWTG